MSLRRPRQRGEPLREGLVEHRRLGRRHVDVQPDTHRHGGRGAREHDLALHLRAPLLAFVKVFPFASFLFSFANFPYGGEVGDMISEWLENFLGTVGTAALLLVVMASYLIWQFNPAFNLPVRGQQPGPVIEEEDIVASLCCCCFHNIRNGFLAKNK